jgi:menaquinone-9 beta-reductase
MTRCDALVVGGGPAGSTCARRLRAAGWDVVVLDRAAFPRDKVCAGWLTPGVFPLLDLDPAEYRGAGLTMEEITAFRTGVLPPDANRGRGRLIETRYPRVVSYAVRRCEFDDFLLRRSKARVLEQTPVRSIARGRDRWIVNDAIEAPILIGAGGHFCPVARHIQGAADVRTPVVAKEAEFEVGVADDGDHPPELLFCRDFEGYAWCVRKGRYLNVGIGRRESQQFAAHVNDFIARLEADGTLPRNAAVRWKGHAYFASGVGPRPLVSEGVVIVGDAAGLAHPESGEGIHPAIESGRLAADTLVAAGGRCRREDLAEYADAITRRHPPVTRPSAPFRAASAAVGRLLLGSPIFTRRVLLDRWFLRGDGLTPPKDPNRNAGTGSSTGREIPTGPAYRASSATRRG